MCKLCSCNSLKKDVTSYTAEYLKYVEQTDLAASGDSLDNQKEFAKRGLLMESVLRLPENSGTVFDAASYQSFLGEEKPRPATIHPTLWEHANLNMNVGLYRVNNIETTADEDAKSRLSETKFKVSQGDVFQIRGYDLANMTLLKGKTGWIIMDVLTTSETAGAAMAFVGKVLGEVSVSAVIYSHSHVDHYGGVAGVLQSGSEVPIYAPEHFLEAAVSENVYAGNAMTSRAVFMYGSVLEHGEKGQVDAGLGKATAAGTRTLIAPTVEIKYTEQEQAQGWCERVVDEIPLQFQLTPGTEAPAEMNVYLPQSEVLFIAENCTGTLHNLYTLRGAEVRDPMAWAGFLDKTITLFRETEIVCSSHNWPHFNSPKNKESTENPENSENPENLENTCMTYLALQRDVYRYLANTTLHLMNQGYTLEEVGRKVEMLMPDTLRSEWCNHGFYGTVNHNAKAVCQRYLGWYDGNPSNLNKLIPTEAATRYVACMGGMEKVLAFGADAVAKGEYAWAAELLNRAVFATPTDSEEAAFQNQAKLLNADALEQLGYQSESGPWRNEYLTAAKLLRAQASGEPSLPARPFALDESIVNAMTPEMLLQYAGILFDGFTYHTDHCSCAGIITFSDVTGVDRTMTVWADRGVLNYRQGESPTAIDFALVTTKYNFYLMLTEDTDTKSTAAKKKDEDGNKDKLRELLSYMTVFSSNFNIITPKISL